MASLSRKFLAGIGIEDEKADLIIEKHQEVLTEVKEERDNYKTEAEKLSAVQKELDELKESTKDGKEDSYKVKYEAIKEDFDNYKKDIESKATHEKKLSAYKNLLKEAGVSDRRIEAVLKVSDVDKVEFEDDGKVKNEADYLKNIKEEWSDFITTQETHGASTATPPQGSGSTAAMSKADILKIKDTTERQNAWKEYLNASSAAQQKG